MDQQHSSIDPEKTVYEVISQNSDLLTLGGRQVNARGYCSRFNFTGGDQEKNAACCRAANGTGCTWPWL